MEPLRLKLKKGDLLAAALVVLVAACLGGWLLTRADSGLRPVAVVYQNGQPLRTLALDDVTERVVFTVDGGYHSEITAEPGRIRFSASDCPGADCVHSGWISSAGRSAVCLPNRVEIRVQGGEADVDGVAR